MTDEFFAVIENNKQRLCYKIEEIDTTIKQREKMAWIEIHSWLHNLILELREMSFRLEKLSRDELERQQKAV